MPSSTLLQPGGRSHRLVVLLVLLLSFSSYRATDESDITCTQSGMCSVGKNQYFYGEIETSAGFKSALESVSYKREVIVVSTAGARCGLQISSGGRAVQERERSSWFPQLAQSAGFKSAQEAVSYKRELIGAGFKAALEAVSYKGELIVVSTAGAGFKSALEAVSYKREVIVVSTAGAKYLEYLFQLHNQFKRLGIAHFLALSMKELGRGSAPLAFAMALPGQGG
eukprot:gene32692-17147_t